MKLQGKNTVVTGAGSGIGRAIALELAGEGAAVAIMDINLEAAEAVAQAVREKGQRVLALKVDVADFSEVTAAISRIYKEFQRIDILVNDAGFGQYLPFWQLTEGMWDRMIAVHLKGTFNCTRAVIEGMIAQKSGRIINISSVGGVTGTPTHCHYSAAKAGIIGLTKALAKEVAPLGITVNAVAPGLIDTPLVQKDLTEELKRIVLQRTLVGRIGTPEDIAYTVAFLAADEASFITGQVISPNGGYVI